MSNTTVSGVASILDGDLSVSDLAQHVQTLTHRIDDLEAEVTKKDEHITELRADLEQKDTQIEELEDRVADLANTVDEAKAHRTAITRKTQAWGERIDELQAREFEKGAHLLAENVEEDRISVMGSKLERITKDDGKTYFRLPGEEDALGRGGAVAHSTVDLLPI